MPTHRTIAALLLMSLGVMPGGPAHAVNDYERERITKHLDSPMMNMDESVFDGESFNPAMSLERVTKYYNDFVRQMNFAIRAWNQVPSAKTQTDEARALLARIQRKQTWFKAMEAAYPAFRESKLRAADAAPPETPAQEAGTGSASGGMSDYQKQRILQYLDSERMRRDENLFDGAAFSTSAPAAAVKSYHDGYMSDLAKAARAWSSQIASGTKATPDGQALQQRLLDADRWGKAMAAAYPDYAANVDRQEQASANQAAAAAATAQVAKADHRAACVAFNDAAMKPLHRDPMARLINQQLHGNSQIGSVDGVETHAQVAGEVAGVCANSDLKLLTSQPCWYVMNRPALDPQHWCAAAADARPLIQAAVINHAKSVIDITGSSAIQTPEQLRERDGFLTFEGPVTYTERMYFNSGSLSQVQEGVAGLLQSAGIDNAEQALWGGQAQRLDALRAEVEKLAGSWTVPEEAADNYSTALAAAQVRRDHPEAEVHDALLSRATWKIHRNPLGVILRRTMPGYVLFKLPDDPLCQLRPYTLTEQYTGAGNYQQAAGVKFGYVRFQTCP